MNSNQQKAWDIEYRKGIKWGKETQTLQTMLKGKKVLELGVGNGKTLISVIKQKPAHVSAIDFSQEAINSCKLVFSDKKISLIKGDVKKLPFKDKEFDFVVCYYILNNLLEKDRIRAVSEIYRVSRKKGIVLFEDLAAGDFREKTGKRLELHTHKKKNGIICHFFSKAELVKLFEKFSKIEITEKISKPFRNKPKITRRIIAAIVNK